MSRPRVLLVDDDTSIRRFVALALEDLDIDLIGCASVAEALTELRAAPVALLVTDLMMPGESGFDLLQRLSDNPVLRAGARLAVFSAGLNAAAQAKLTHFDIWRQLPKPISVLELEACVSEALAGTAGERPQAAGPGAMPSADGTADVLAPAEVAAVAKHFGGDEGLFRAFRATCAKQFGNDLHSGNACVDRGDPVALRHLAHSLKSVLATLGYEPLGEIARRLEGAAAAADWAAAHALWTTLQSGLGQLAKPATGHGDDPPPSR